MSWTSDGGEANVADYAAMSDNNETCPTHNNQTTHPSSQPMSSSPLGNAGNTFKESSNYCSDANEDELVDNPDIQSSHHNDKKTSVVKFSRLSKLVSTTTIDGAKKTPMTDSNGVFNDNDAVERQNKERFLLSQSIFSAMTGHAHYKDEDDDDENFDDQIERYEKLSNLLAELAIHERSNAPQYSRELVGQTEGLINCNQSLRASMNWNEIDAVLEMLIEREFPYDNAQIPNLREVIHVGDLCEPRFCPGAWVEIRGDDMKWRLAMITKVSKEAPPDYDWNDPNNEGKEPEWTYYYQAGDERRLSEEELRSPKEGLVRIFGSRPWVWQQWACLKLEQILRFQEGHQHDFELLDVQRYATELWEHWLHHPRNRDFYHHFMDDRIGNFGRSELVEHIMTPFVLMDRIATDDGKWGFENDPDISIYTYLSLFGGGFVVPVVIVFVQITVMLLLFFNADHRRNWDGSMRDEEGNDEQDVPIIAMAAVVMLLYLVKVVPDIMVRFYNAVGSADTVYSRLCSIRRKIYLERGDRPGQKVGYAMDMFMNTSYVAILYVLNVYIIINAEEALDVILNSLALEFLDRLDESITQSAWWDRKRRWLRAGAVEVVIQHTLQKQFLKSPAAFSEEFNIPEEVVLNFCGNHPLLFCDKNQATADASDPRFMTKTELIKSRCKDIALRKGNSRAVKEYQKQKVFFGSSETFFHRICFCGHDGLFGRHTKYRTWSRWQKVLYYSPIPNLDAYFVLDDNNEPILSKDLESNVHFVHHPFINCEDDSEKDAASFTRKFFKVLFFVDLVRELKSNWRKMGHTWFLFRLLDGLMVWFSFTIQLLFVLYVVKILYGIVQYFQGN